MKDVIEILKGMAFAFILTIASVVFGTLATIVSYNILNFLFS